MANRLGSSYGTNPLHFGIGTHTCPYPPVADSIPRDPVRFRQPQTLIWPRLTVFWGCRWIVTEFAFPFFLTFRFHL